MGRLLRGTTPNSFREITLPGFGGARYSAELLENWLPARNMRRLRVLQNGKIVRFETAANDHGDPSELTTLNERTELLTVDFKTAQSHLLYQFGEDIWLSMGFMVAPGDRIISSYNIVGQMHSVLGSLNVNRQPTSVLNLEPQTDAEFESGTIKLDFQSRHADPVPPTATNVTSTTRWQKTIKRGLFYNLVIRMRYSLTQAAQLEVWVNGAKEASVSDFNMGYNEPGAPGAAYWQFGHYRHHAIETLVTYVANMEQSKQSLTGRILDPLPIPLL